MTTFFEKWGYPEYMTKEPKPSKTGMQTIFESKVYQEFKKLRGPYIHPNANVSKKVWNEYLDRCDDLAEVKSILTFLRQNLQRAANRGNKTQQIEVDLDYVYQVGSSQDFQCAMTGVDLEFTRGGQKWMGKWCNPNSCTIDRIDSSKGYVKGNIQLITWKANCLKQHLDNQEFIDFCKDVAYWNK